MSKRSIWGVAVTIYVAVINILSAADIPHLARLTHETDAANFLTVDCQPLDARHMTCTISQAMILPTAQGCRITVFPPEVQDFTYDASAAAWIGVERDPGQCASRLITTLRQEETRPGSGGITWRYEQQRVIGAPDNPSALGLLRCGNLDQGRNVWRRQPEPRAVNCTSISTP